MPKYLAQSTNWGHFPDQIGIYKHWFLRRGENWSTRRKPLGARTRTNNKLNPHDAESENQTWATLVVGECSHHCAIPAPLNRGLALISFRTTGPRWIGPIHSTFITINKQKTMDFSTLSVFVL